jgi:hypothetical protein
VNISDYQGGGKRGSSTADYIMILKEAIKMNKETYVTFLDVTKAYDKAWADGLLFALHKQGIKDKVWLKVKELDENLKATVRTKYGNTREVNIKDSIRQGGVLSVTLYATVMDEIAKEIAARNIGAKIGNNKRIGCLLWMDDVALIANSKKDMEKLLEITQQIANV